MQQYQMCQFIIKAINTTAGENSFPQQTKKRFGKKRGKQLTTSLTY